MNYQFYSKFHYHLLLDEFFQFDPSFCFLFDFGWGEASHKACEGLRPYNAHLFCLRCQSCVATQHQTGADLRAGVAKHNVFLKRTEMVKSFIRFLDACHFFFFQITLLPVLI